MTLLYCTNRNYGKRIPWYWSSQMRPTIPTRVELKLNWLKTRWIFQTFQEKWLIAAAFVLEAGSKQHQVYANNEFKTLHTIEVNKYSWLGWADCGEKSPWYDTVRIVITFIKIFLGFRHVEPRGNKQTRSKISHLCGLSGYVEGNYLCTKTTNLFFFHQCHGFRKHLQI